MVAKPSETYQNGLHTQIPFHFCLMNKHIFSINFREKKKIVFDLNTLHRKIRSEKGEKHVFVYFGLKMPCKSIRRRCIYPFDRNFMYGVSVSVFQAVVLCVQFELRTTLYVCQSLFQFL